MYVISIHILFRTDGWMDGVWVYVCRFVCIYIVCMYVVYIGFD